MRMGAVVAALLVVLAWVVAALLALVALLLLVPFPFEARGTLRWDDAEGATAAGAARVAWLWGAVAVAFAPSGGTFRLFGIRVARFPLGGARTLREKEPQRPQAPSRWQSAGPRAWLAARHDLARAGRRLLATFRLEGALDGTLGTGDPAADGAVAAALAALRGATAGRLTLALRPRFVDAGLDAGGWVRGRLWLGHLAAVLVSLLFVRNLRRLVQVRPSRKVGGNP